MKTAEAERRKSTIGSKGFTLIEIVITLIVLSIATVGVLSVFTVGISESANPLILNQAVQLAEGEMDQVAGEKAANGFNGINPTCVTTLLPGFACGRNSCYVSAGNLNDTSACGAPTSYKHVTVTITQPTIGSVSLDTIIANY